MSRTQQHIFRGVLLRGIFFLTLWGAGFFSPSLSFAASALDSVVKVFVSSNQIDYLRPWQAHGLTSSTGSGVIIDGNKILTNAHVVDEQTFIQIKKYSNPKSYTARVLAIGHDCDLALLTVDDPDFFKGVPPIDLGELPKLQDTVTVLGYPQGGDQLSITEGVVSRVEMTPYSQSGRQLLAVQIDAAINPGNSGGPVLMNGKLIGIAMQSLAQGQNIGYVIPIPVIGHFFEDLKDGTYHGFPWMGVEYNTTENPSLKTYYGIDAKDGGVLVTKILPFAPAEGHLKKGDIVLEIDDIPIGEDGTFIFRKDERLDLTHLIASKQNNDTITLKIWRNNRIKKIAFPLKAFTPLVPYPNHFDQPPYYVYGGLVFTVLSADLLQEWGANWWENAPLDLTYYLIGAGRLNENRKKEIVVLLHVLPDDINVGYHDYQMEIITDINGQAFDSFQAFVQRLNREKSEKPFTSIQTMNNIQIIINNENVDKADREIIKRNHISQICSEDVAAYLEE